jgi:phage-related protein
MPSVGPGVVEIRVHAGSEYRVMYVAKYSEGIYVPHAFEKRSQQTRKLDIEVARRSLAEVLRNRPR